MTLKDSLTKKNITNHSFKIAFKRNIVATVLSILTLTLAMAIPAITYLKQYIGKDVKVCEFSDTRFSVVYILIVALIGMIQALITFKFLYKRSAVNTYFSIGVNRSMLYKTRVLAGTLSTFISVLVPFIILVLINLVFSSSIGLVLSYAGFLFIGMFVTAIVAYAITTLICSLTYTKAESVTYSILANLFPTLILSGLNGLMSSFLWGNTYGINNSFNYDFHGGLITHYTKLNPLLFFNKYFSNYSSYREWMSMENLFRAELLFLPIIMLFIAILIITITRKIFIKRHIENTSIMGSNKVLANILIGTVMFAGFSVFMYFTRTGSNPMLVKTATLLGILLTTIIYASFVFPLRVVGKKNLKGLILFPINLIVFFLILGIMNLGGLGYTNYIPDIDNIESMEISYRGQPDLVLSMGQSGGVATYLFENNGVFMLTDSEDIELAISLHEKLIKQGWIDSKLDNENPKDFAIRSMTLVYYNLKNGKRIKRLYPIETLSLFDEMLVLDETTAFNQLFSSIMDVDEETFKSIIPEKEFSLISVNQFTLASGKIYVKDILSTKLHLIGENEEIANEIRQALKVDFLNSSLNEKYFPTEIEKYQLYFFKDYNDELPKDIIPSNSHQLYPHGKVTFVVNSTYTNTIEVIEKYYKSESIEIESLYIVDNYNNSLANKNYDEVSPFYKTNIMIISDALSTLPEGFIKIDNPEKIKELYDLTRGIYHISDGGYMVYAKLKGEFYVITRYIPRNLLPAELKEQLGQ
ncbi:MAG: hypothetical protein KAG94_04160 [Clostridiales bacterium]|nr:hypothetical protein [Clostridiales bacterium]